MTNKKINKLVSISLPRVKSIDFHPHKSIFIAGLHTGLIKSYTYEGLHLYTFDFHEGSVRSVKFHPNSDFFISGGDDKIIRMFNYTTKELLHLFKGHADFIRSVDFHPSKPWIISSSDDQSIKIWNFLTKKLIATATGHSHYIMSAKFLNEKFIISGSLDQTIRIWEFNQNKSKFVPDVIVKQIIQGHDRGVNCIEIDNDLVVSGGDDREVKIWEISTNISNNVNDNAFNYGSSTLSSTDNSISIKEIDNHFNHQGSITSIKIHDDLIVSSGEDGYLIIYKNKSHSKYKVEGRIWSVAYKDNIYICGHDNGLDILEYKEPDLISITEKGCFYYKNKFLYFTNLESEYKVCKVYKDAVKIFSIEDYVLIQYINKFCIYKNKKLFHEGNGLGVLMYLYSNTSEDCCKQNLKDNNSDDFILYGNILEGLCTIQGCYNNSFNIIYSTIDNIILSKYYIYVRTGSSLLRYSFDGTQSVINVGFEVDNVVHDNIDYDNHNLLNSICDLANSSISDNSGINKFSSVVFYNKNTISIYDNDLNLINQEFELSHITGGFFYKNVFIYSTSKHVKYIFEETGILRSINEKMMPISFKNNLLYYVKNYEISSVELDLTEIFFKESVIKNEDISKFIESKSLPGLSPLEFLIKKKKGDKALPYIKDKRLRFELLLSKNELNKCFELAISEEETREDWIKKILEVSLREADIDMAEKCLINMEEWYELFLLYVCSGRNMENIFDLVDQYTKKIISIYTGINTIDRYNNLEYKKDEKFKLMTNLSDSKKNIKNNEILNKFENLSINNKNKFGDNLDKKDASDENVLNYKKNLEIALKNVTEGNFVKSLEIFKSLFSEKCADTHFIGMYISGLLSQIYRKKENNPYKQIVLSLYFSSLDLISEHKKLAQLECINVLYKNNNFKMAKKLLENYKININNKIVKRVLNNENDTDQYNVNVTGKVYCWDTMDFEDNGNQCSRCGVYNKTGSVCSLCENMFK